MCFHVDGSGFFCICHRFTAITVQSIVGCLMLLKTLRFSKNFLRHIASLAALQVAIHFASKVELTIQDCVTLLQTMLLSPNVNIDPDVDLRESLSVQK